MVISLNSTMNLQVAHKCFLNQILPDYKILNHVSFTDCLPEAEQKMATMTSRSTITLQERAANAINSTTLGTRVAVELEPNVCVKTLKVLQIDLILHI